MPITPKISPRIISSIATLYNDVNRIFMEYIDNSIDSADQYWFDPVNNKYKKPIEITISFSGKNARSGHITISDNCFGITNFTKVVESIGDSDKKRQGFTNGEFGFGIYSYMGACSTLDITSKEASKKALHLELHKDQFNQKRLEDVIIADPTVKTKFPYKSGTVIQLRKFNSGTWRSVNAKTLKEEIEKHFELVLNRENLVIKIIAADSSEEICKPFDYDNFEGEVYEDRITHLDVETGGRYKKKYTSSLKPPVKVFLKMTRGLSLNKPPIFISKGRRISEIKNIRSFKSRHKSDIWGHSSVTGYIDLQDLLGPTIARNDFRNTAKSRTLYKQLYELEELIIDFVKRANARTDENHYQQLEDALNKALSKLARIDAMNFQTYYSKGDDTNLAGGSTGIQLDEGGGMKDFGDGHIENPGPGIGEDEGKGVGLIEGGETLPGNSTEGEQAKNEELFADSEFKGKERKKSGFNIHISDAEPQVDAITEKQLRSMLSGNEIIIFKKHPDFQLRLQHTRQGESKISERLLAYIAGEITVHYKDEFYNKNESGQPEYNKNMFIGLVEFIYQLEDALSALTGKNLSEL